MTESSTQEDPKTDLDSAPRGRLARGSKVIADHVKRLPNKPGVYRMFGEDGEVLYVGKAKNLKNRVTSYTRMAGHTNRIARMISATVAMEFITTTTETEALLLEANMIKRLRPRFNVVLRDDKSFPYILITEDHEAPQIVKHRGARRRKGKYFGPFASAGSVDRTINALQRAFLLRSCTDSVYESRARPCLLYQIKRCSAPCTGEVSPPDYAKLVDEARGFLSGKSQAIRAELSQQMEEAAAQMEFESAAIYRDRLQALSHTQGHQGINPRSIENADIFACHIEGGQACVQVFFIRTGQNWGNRAYFPRMDKSHSAGEILESFLGQFYDDRDCPPLILVSEAFDGSDLLSEALSIKLGRKVQVTAPKRGERRELVTHALTNAREALGRKLADTASQTKLLSGIAEAFELDTPPRRIEVYDNSHIQGSSPIGAMIVAGPDGFIKNQYRKFNIKDSELTPGDDYAMMREVLTRRFSRLLKEHPRDEISSEDEGIPAWPDLLLIDGGKGQLSAVRGVLADLGLSDITTVGVAKGPDRDAGRERFFIEGRDAITLPGRDPVLYYIQRLRDEAHRFAIGTHRARRKKAMVANPLDEIAGIGPTRKKALLHHFGSAKAVSRAKISDLRAVDGVSAMMAQTIFDHFHDKG